MKNTLSIRERGKAIASICVGLLQDIDKNKRLIAKNNTKIREKNSKDKF